jgi:hypothetical protein
VKVLDVEHFWKLMYPPVKSDTIGVVLAHDQKVLEIIRQAQSAGQFVFLRVKGRKA